MDMSLTIKKPDLNPDSLDEKSLTISLCMIVKDEEDNLAQCLDSVKDLVDEINIVDTGSTDRTMEIASQYTDRVFTFEWNNDFSAARNFSFSKATKDYCMWLDADDVITDENRTKFIAMKEELDPSIDVVLSPYDYYQDKKTGAKFTHVRERLIKRDAGFYWDGVVHERITTDDPNITSAFTDVVITHSGYETSKSSDRNKVILKSVIDSGKAGLREKYYHAMTLYSDGEYEESLKWFHEFLNELGDGYFECTNGILAMHDIYLKMNEPDKALAVLMDNESLCSDMSEFYCALGNHFRDIQNNQWNASTCYEKALTCEGLMRDSSLPALKQDIYYYSVPLRALGQCQVKLNQFSEALTSYKRARIYNKKDMVLKELCDNLEKLVLQIGA
jgi:glycosyltransferase involved in cell wall biosynthesis